MLKGTPVQTCKKMRVAAKRSRSESSGHFSASKSVAQKAMEEALTKRLDALSAEDRELFEMKKDRERRISKLMEDNENDIHLLKVQHLLRIQELETGKPQQKQSWLNSNLRVKGTTFDLQSSKEQLQFYLLAVFIMY